MPPQFERDVKVGELARYLEVCSVSIVRALLSFLFLGCFSDDNLKIIGGGGV